MTDIKIGTKIWRPIFVNDFDKSKNVIHRNIDIDKTNKGSYMIKALESGEGRIGYPKWISWGSKGNGLICFSNDEPLNDWTYFEVTGISKSGKAVFVKPVYGSEDELLAQYN